MYFWQIQNFAYGEINERSFSNPHPWLGQHLRWFLAPGSEEYSANTVEYAPLCLPYAAVF